MSSAIAIVPRHCSITTSSRSRRSAERGNSCAHSAAAVLAAFLNYNKATTMLSDRRAATAAAAGAASALGVAAQRSKFPNVALKPALARSPLPPRLHACNNSRIIKFREDLKTTGSSSPSSCTFESLYSPDKIHPVA